MTSNNASDAKLPPDNGRTRPNVQNDSTSGSGCDDSHDRVAPAIRSASQTTLGHLLLAKKLYQKGRYSLALRELDKTLSLNPELSTAYLFRGVISFKLAKLDDARQSLLTAVQLQDDLFQAWIVLAQIEREVGHFDKALEDITQAIKADPKNPAAYLIMGSILEAMQREEDAAAAYREVIRFSPNSRVARYKLGSVLVKIGNNEEAEQQILAAYRLSPTDRMSRIALGDLHLARGEIDRAIDAYKAAAELDFKRSAVPRAKLGEAYFRAGLPREAVISLLLAVRFDPKQVHSFLLLGRIYMQQLKQPEAAAEMFKAAIEIDGRYPEAQRLYEEAQAAIRAQVDADNRPHRNGSTFSEDETD